MQTRVAVIGLFMLLLFACGKAPGNTDTNTGISGTTSGVERGELDERCPVFDSRKWAAWINRMPKPNPFARLHVVGEIDLPSAGYTGSLRLGPVDLSSTPRLNFKLHLVPPTEKMPQIITPTEVRYDGEAQSDHYRIISITCGNTLITEIPDVETVE